MNYNKISKNKEVIKLIKQIEEIKNKVRSIDEKSLINYEIELQNEILGIDVKFVK